jgi:hypothetical protein
MGLVGYYIQIIDFQARRQEKNLLSSVSATTALQLLKAN